MAFLVPAFLAGLVLIGVPVLIHLTRKQKSKVVVFPSLMFLQRIPYTSENRRRIHHWFLLSLRALAVLLLVIAFSRPFFDRSDEVATSGGGPTERVILIDQSWSMGLEDRFEAAQAAARTAVSNLGPLDRASVIVFGQGATAVARSTADPSRLRQAIDTASVSSEATRYGPGLKLAQAILDGTELPDRELVVISDFQRNGWTGEEGVLLPQGTQVRTVRIGAGEGVANHAVAGVTLSREVVQGRERITPTARLTRLGGEEPLEVEASLILDGQVLQTRPVTLPANGAELVTFQPFTLSERHTQGTIRITGDELPRDDESHFILSPGRALGVTVMGAPSQGNSGDLYLRRALEISEGNRFDVATAASIPGADALSQRSVVVLNDRPFPGGAEGQRLRSWIENGGGLLLVAGERGGWPAEFSDILPGQLGRIVDPQDGRGERLGRIAFDHPIFEVFRGPRTGDFTGVRFYRARAHTVEESDSIRVIARFDDGSPALTEQRVGAGRVLVWTSTLDASWTDLALQPVFLPFAHQLVRYASGRSDAIQAFTTGQILDVSDSRAMETAGLGEVADALAAAEDRIAFSPSGSTQNLGDAAAGSADRFLTLVEAGFYEIRPPGADDIRPVAVAVNVERAEADIAGLDPEEFAATLGSGMADGALPPGEAERALELRRADQEQRQSYWRLLLLAAFVILVIETVVSNRLSRRAARRGKHAQATG